MWKRAHFVSREPAIDVEIEDKPLLRWLVRVEVGGYVHVVVAGHSKQAIVLPLEDLLAKQPAQEIRPVLRTSGYIGDAQAKNHAR